jgi:hypothetical protein
MPGMLDGHRVNLGESWELRELALVEGGVSLMAVRWFGDEYTPASVGRLVGRCVDTVVRSEFRYAVSI